jgi:hypothetical protein
MTIQPGPSGHHRYSNTKTAQRLGRNWTAAMLGGTNVVHCHLDQQIPLTTLTRGCTQPLPLPGGEGGMYAGGILPRLPPSPPGRRQGCRRSNGGHRASRRLFFWLARSRRLYRLRNKQSIMRAERLTSNV